MSIASKLKITKTHFYIISLLILLLPISREYKMYIFGKKAEGIVLGSGMKSKQYSGGTRFGGRSISKYYYTILEFKVEGKNYLCNSDRDIEINIGEERTILYDKENPEKSILANPMYLYSGAGAALPLILFFIWISFYSAFIKPHQKKKSRPIP